jgi:hypothetical protein
MGQQEGALIVGLIYIGLMAIETRIGLSTLLRYLGYKLVLLLQGLLV